MTTVATSPQLLGRESDLLAIADAIESICAGEGSVLVIEGPAGIGKTSLVAEARRLARTSRVRTLSARGGELEREFAFGVIRQLFEPALNAAAESERSEWLAGTAALAAPLFDPATLGRFPGDPGFQRRHGLYWLAANIAGSSERGLMLLVDDVHWADSASLGRAEARCRRYRRPVSSTRPPNRTCPFLSIRLSTGHAVADRDADFMQRRAPVGWWPVLSRWSPPTVRESGGRDSDIGSPAPRRATRASCLRGWSSCAPSTVA